MPKRRLILGILALAILAVLIFAFTRPGEPSYRGHSLSKWALIYSDQLPGHELAPEAIKHIGTNAVPYLLDWIKQPREPHWQRQLARKLQWLPAWLRPRALASQDPRYAAAFPFFAMLGPQANVAVPELTRLTRPPSDSFLAYNAMAALASIGGEGLPPLLTILTNRTPDRTVVHNVTALLRLQGTNARPAIPVLVQFLGGPDLELARISAGTLGQLRIEPAIVVPALVTNLHHPDGDARASAAQALGRFGNEARQAAIPLIPLLTDTHLRCRREATNALRKIAPEALTNALPRQPNPVQGLRVIRPPR